MAKAILICGKIASGKTVYAKTLAETYPAVILSVDEITIRVLGGELGEKHDEIAQRVQQYLFDKSVEILNTGTNVILDWGFWSRKTRCEACAFYAERGFAYEMHYVEVSDEVWEMNIKKRNALIESGKVKAYRVDAGLKEKLLAVFEEPKRSEIDVWHVCHWM